MWQHLLVTVRAEIDCIMMRDACVYTYTYTYTVMPALIQLHELQLQTRRLLLLQTRPFTTVRGGQLPVYV